MAVKPLALYPCLTKGALALIRDGVSKRDKQLLAQGIALLEAINAREQRALADRLASEPDEDRLGRGIEPETEY